MSRLRDKAHAAYAPYHDGQHPASLASKRVPLVDHDDDELKILGGKTNVIAAPPQASLPSLSTGSQKSSAINYPGSPAMVMQLPPTNHLDSVHPSLVQYLAQSPTPRGYSVPPSEQPMVCFYLVSSSSWRFTPQLSFSTTVYTHRSHNTLMEALTNNTGTLLTHMLLT